MMNTRVYIVIEKKKCFLQQSDKGFHWDVDFDNKAYSEMDSAINIMRNQGFDIRCRLILAN